MHRNYNRAQKKQTNTSMTEITKEQTSEETKKRTKQHASQQMYEQTIAKQNQMESIAVRIWHWNCAGRQNLRNSKNTNARTTATRLESLIGKTQTDHFKARPHNRIPRANKHQMTEHVKTNIHIDIFSPTSHVCGDESIYHFHETRHGRQLTI